MTQLETVSDPHVSASPIEKLEPVKHEDQVCCLDLCDDMSAFGTGSLPVTPSPEDKPPDSQEETVYTRVSFHSPHHPLWSLNMETLQRQPLPPSPLPFTPLRPPPSQYNRKSRLAITPRIVDRSRRSAPLPLPFVVTLFPTRPVSLYDRLHAHSAHPGSPARKLVLSTRTRSLSVERVAERIVLPLIATTQARQRTVSLLRGLDCMPLRRRLTIARSVSWTSCREHYPFSGFKAR